MTDIKRDGRGGEGKGFNVKKNGRNIGGKGERKGENIVLSLLHMRLQCNVLISRLVCGV